AADALFLVTDDVDDFAAVDLASAGIAAVGPDLFLSERTTKAGYREAIEWLSARMTSPQRTPSKLHGAISRRHPRLRSRHADVYPGAASPVVGGTPQVEFRGDRCLRCLARVEAPTNAIGLCAACATAVAGGHNAKPKPAWRAGGTK
ncbi:MAG: hypothetical protein LBG60_10480, partial [Bifidobacteriaceae bacterium]|nr:hypothetical protein [Bifidobacteriaceae bacterium]